MKNFERSLLPENAISHLDEKKYNLTVNLIRFDCEYPIYKCYLTDNINQHVYIGGGGGLGAESKASAIFEAAQHYFSTHATQINKRTIHFSSIAKMPPLDYLLQHEFLPKNLMNFPDQELPWLQYESYTDAQLIHYPLVLTEVRLQHLPELSAYMNFNWMSHDTGMAIGCDFLEASIHGINEWIEQDAYGLLLLKLFIKQPNEKIHLVNHTTIPENLYRIVKYIEQTFAEELLIVDMTSDINVPAFVVSFTKQKKKFQPIGMGASLSRAYALERAIFEALQSHILYNEKTKKSQLDIANALKKTPLLLSAAKCDLAALIANGEIIPIDFTHIADYAHIVDLSTQLNKLHELLSRQGFKAFYHCYYQVKNRISCLGIIIPGLDQFFLVRGGKLIMPKSRGLGVLQN